MSEVLIETPRGLSLSGSFVNPVDSTDCAVLFSHSFLSDRHSGGHFDRLAGHYRTAGYATLAFDYSGHGLSDDDIITLDSHAEDLRAASGWLADQGFHRQLIHAHSYGATVAMNAAPPAATTMVLSGAVLGPVSYDWQAIFLPSSLMNWSVTALQPSLTIHPALARTSRFPGRLWWICRWSTRKRQWIT